MVAVGKFVYDWWYGPRQGGLVIDLRPDAKDDLYRTRDVPFGFAIVYTAGGKVTIETKDAPKDAMERLLGEVIKGAYDTVKSIADAARSVPEVGDIKPEPAAA